MNMSKHINSKIAFKTDNMIKKHLQIKIQSTGYNNSGLTCLKCHKSYTGQTSKSLQISSKQT
jgi:hypothetical protein